MAHAIRRNYPSVAPDAQQAGVLALFFPKDNKWHIVLIERDSRNPNDRHRGQISFPGGRFEAADGVLSATALREAEEEVGVRAQDIQLLGALTRLYIPVSNFAVSPFVGLIPYQPTFSPQESEVQSILEVPFDLFKQPGAIRKKDMRMTNNIVLQDVPYFDVYGRTVWGATAMMLSELIELIN